MLTLQQINPPSFNFYSFALGFVSIGKSCDKRKEGSTIRNSGLSFEAGREAWREKRRTTEGRSVCREVQQNRWVDTPTPPETKEIKSDTSLAIFNKRSRMWLCDSAADSSSSARILMHSRSPTGSYKEWGSYFLRLLCWTSDMTHRAGFEFSSSTLVRTRQNVQRMLIHVTWHYTVCRAKRLKYHVFTNPATSSIMKR